MNPQPDNAAISAAGRLKTLHFITAACGDWKKNDCFLFIYRKNDHFLKGKSPFFQFSDQQMNWARQMKRPISGDLTRK